MPKSGKNTSQLVATLLPEAFQTEESASVHGRREAERLDDAPPAVALRRVSAHAERALRELRALAEARGEGKAKSGSVLGRLFSTMRDLGTDLVLSSEKSYRGTLLGIEHGIALFTLLESAASTSGDAALAAFCQRWLAERRPLAAAVEQELAWFAEHPDIALERARVKKHRVRPDERAPRTA